MKTRLIVITVICIIAGLLGWFLNPPPADTPKPAETKSPAKSEAPKVAVGAAPVAPVKPTQIAAPVAPPAIVKPDAPASTKPAAVSTADPMPQSDLKGLFDQTIRLLEAHDIVAVIKTIMPPDETKSMMEQLHVSTPEELAAALRQQMPDLDKRADDMLQAMQAVQGMTPELSTDGNRATYKVDPPIGDNDELTFVKIDGNWYLR
jgi:hypothetical protein